LSQNKSLSKLLNSFVLLTGITISFIVQLPHINSELGRPAY